VEEIQWYYPESLDQLPELLAGEGVVPHGGGTGILRTGLKQIKGFVDTSRLGLKFLEKRKDAIVLGAGLSYSEAAEALAKENGQHILCRSLDRAATQPLRNRITLGGSIAMFPYWSDLVGPLLALEAELHLAGSKEGSWPVSDYAADRELRRGTLISSIRFQDIPWRSAYIRYTRTPTDRPAFSLSMLSRGTEKRLEEIRLVVVGCSGRYRRLTEIEQRLAGKSTTADPEELAATAAQAVAGLDLEIPARMGFSGEYLSHCARVELGRLVESILRRPS